MTVASSLRQTRMSAGERQRQIVETVLELTAKRGAEAVSVQAIADEIGLTQPAVFRHFPTKEHIWVAVMDWLELRLVEIYERACAGGGGDAMAGLRRVFLDHLGLIAQRPAVAKVVFSDHLRLQFPQLHQRFAGIHEVQEKRVRQFLVQAKADGALPQGASPAIGARMLLCMIQGLAFQSAIACLPIQIEREGKRLFSLFLAGLASEA